jgi:hypothetical protein
MSLVVSLGVVFTLYRVGANGHGARLVCMRFGFDEIEIEIDTCGRGVYQYEPPA